MSTRTLLVDAGGGENLVKYYNPVGWAQSKVAVLLERKMVNIADTFNEVGLQKLLMIIYFKIKPAGSELRKEEVWNAEKKTDWLTGQKYFISEV